jgi:hypothetical protein
VLTWLRSQGSSTPSQQRVLLKTAEAHLDDYLTEALVERILGWRIGPDRFLMGDRQWLPRWRFQPLTRLEDAFRLLRRVAPQDYAIGVAGNGSCWARVRVDGVTGEACELLQARAVTLAIARAIGLEVDSVE